MQGFRQSKARSADPALLRHSIQVGGLALIFGACFTQMAHSAPDTPAVSNPMQIVVSLPKQRVSIYKGSELIATSRVSTGKRGHATPAGIFSILQKRKRHRSNIYRNAPMPYMQRITWSGLALHAGKVPNYPASHGCVRLPYAFAKKLFSMQTQDTHVVVTGADAAPEHVAHDTLFQPTPLPTLLTMPHQPSDDDAALEVASNEPVAKAYVTRIGPYTVEDTRSAAFGVLDLEHDLGRLEAHGPLPTKPVRILVTRRTGRERLKDVQTVLLDLGYDPDGIDGYMGKGTARAVKGFQKDNGLSPTGIVTDDLIAALFKTAGRDVPPVGHLYVRRNYIDIFDAPVTIRDPEKPLGVHLFTAQNFDKHADEAPWLSLTLQKPEKKAKKSKKWAKRRKASTQKTESAPAPVDVSAVDALDRIEIPAEIKTRISKLLTPGSSFAISDHGISKETGKGTDFVVLVE